MPHDDSAAIAASPDRLEWLATAVAEATWMGLLITLALLLVGLPAAVFGLFEPLPVVAVSLLLVIGLRVAVGAAPFARPGGGAALAVGVLVIGGVGATNLWFSGQHHATERDPGVYLETALWLSEEGTLLVDGLQGPFADVEGVRAGGFGFFDVGRDDGRLHPQFSHGTAVVLAAADGVGGPNVLARVPALLTALAALALWFAARPLAGSWGATLAVTILSVSLLSVHHARDTFSEPLAQLLVVGALAVLVHAGRDVRLHVVAGLLVGLGVAARIDAVIIVLGLAALVAILGRSRHAVGLAAGAVVGVLFGLVDLALRSDPYLESNLSSVRGPLVLAGALSVMGLLRPVAGAVPAWWTIGRRRQVAGVLGALVVAGVAFALWVRPEVETARQGAVAHIAGLQERDGLIVEPDRTYAEQSMQWLAWYLGVPVVLAAGFGAAVAVGRALVRAEQRWFPLLALCGPVTLLYLWRPRIVADQMWATRRFVPATLPLLAVLAAVAVVAVARWLRGRVGGAGGLATAAAVAVVLVPGSVVSAAHWDDETLYWPRSDVEALCPAVGDDAAVLVLAEDNLDNHLPRALARACDVPVAAGALDAVDVAGLAEAWAAEDRRLVVVGARTSTDISLVETGRRLLRITRLEASVERRPERVERFAQEVVVHDVVS